MTACVLSLSFATCSVILFICGSLFSATEAGKEDIEGTGAIFGDEVTDKYG